MSRRHAAEKREIVPDAKYGDLVVAKFMNCVMLHGAKATAEKIVYGALDRVAEKTKMEPFKAFAHAWENVKPPVEVTSRRVGGATYPVPVEVRPERKQALAIRWIINAALSRSEETMEQRVAGECMEAWSNKGAAGRKREETHGMAEVNKAFSHYRW